MRREALISAIDSVVNALINSNVLAAFERGLNEPGPAASAFESFAFLSKAHDSFGEAENYIIKTFEIEPLFRARTHKVVGLGAMS